jgi:hypothetical protein
MTMILGSLLMSLMLILSFRSCELLKEKQLLFGMLFKNTLVLDFSTNKIEQEFGINPDTHEEIGHKFGEEVDNIRIKTQDKLIDFNQQIKNTINELKTQLREKEDAIISLKENTEKDINKAKEEIHETLTKHYIEKEAANFKKYDEEKHELYQMMREIENNNSPAKKSSRSKKVYEFKDWLMNTQGNKSGKIDHSPKEEGTNLNFKETTIEEILPKLKEEDIPEFYSKIIDKFRVENDELTK